MVYIGTTVTGCGIGTSLLQQFTKMVDSKGLIGYFHVERNNNPHFKTLIDWYTRHGFHLKELDNLYSYYLTKVDVVMMIRSINNFKVVT